MAESILKSFDVWMAVQGLKSKGRVKSIDNISLEGIAKLRELILELAVRGKLVPQDERDEPASALLQRIKQERKNPTKTGKFKNDKELPAIIEEEIPFSLPDNWVWCRMGEITDYGTSPKVETNSLSENAWLLELEDIEPITSRIIRKVRFKERKSLSTKNQFRKGDVLYSKLRPYLDKVIVADEDGACSSEILPLRMYQRMNAEFFRLRLKSPDFIHYANSKVYGMNLPRLGSEDGRKAIFPLPPLAEQHRIVAKVDELMALCDQLEAVQTTNLKTHQALVKTLLQTLTQAPNADELHQAWQRMAPHFDTLFCTEDSIEQLKQTVLRLAIMGRLVKQSPTDEPATVLLKRIKAEKAKLVKAGKLKKGLPAEALRRREKLLPPIGDDDVPFALPQGWVWCRLGEIANKITDGFHNTPPRVQKGVPYILATHVKSEGIDFENCFYVSEKDHKELWAKTYPKKGELLLVNIGAGCGTPAIIDVDFEFSFKNSAIIKQPREIETYYLFYYLLSIREKVYNKIIQGGAQPYLSLKMINNLVFPLPPLAEQQRIVTKVQQLQQQLSQLESRLQQSSIYSRQLMETVLRQAFEEKGKVYEMQEDVLSMVAEGD